MRISTGVNTLRVEDFPSQKDWIERLFYPLNQFITSATQAINGQITFGDNIPGVTQNLRFTYSTSSFPISFRWTFQLQPVEVRLCSAYENDVPVILVFSWSYASGQITIQSVFKITSAGVVGLTTGSVYNLTFRGQL